MKTLKKSPLLKERLSLQYCMISDHHKTDFDIHDSEKDMSRDFIVNDSFTVGNQLRPSISINRQGDYMIAWHGLGEGGDGIYARHFNLDTASVEVGKEFRIPTPENSLSVKPVIILRDDGSFVVVWQSLRVRSSENLEASINETLQNIQISANNNTDIDNEYFETEGVIRDGSRIYIQIYIPEVNSSQEESGIKPILEMPIQVSSTDLGEQRNPVIDSASDGKFIIAWEREVPQVLENAFIYKHQINARIYDSSGNPITDAFRVDKLNASDSFYPSVASKENDEFLIAWSDADTGIIYVQNYNHLGESKSEVISVNTSAHKVYEGGSRTNEKNRPLSEDRPISIHTMKNDNFIVTWSGQNSNDIDSGDTAAVIYARLYDAMMQPLTEVFRVDDFEEQGASVNPCVSTDKEGNFVIIWEWSDTAWENGQPGVFAKAYNANAISYSEKFLVNSEDFSSIYGACEGEINPALDMDDDGNFIAAWNYGDIEGGIEGLDIYARSLNFEFESVAEKNDSAQIDLVSLTFPSINNLLHTQGILSSFEVQGVYIPLSILLIVRIVQNSLKGKDS